MARKEYSAREKVEVLNWYHKEKATQGETATKFGVTRRSIHNWLKDEDELRELAKYEGLPTAPEEEITTPEEIKDYIQKTIGEIAVQARYAQGQLESIDTIEKRKQLFVSLTEKTMWELMNYLSEIPKQGMKPTDASKMLKELNEIREKLAGDPSVIIEHRMKWQGEVYDVAKEIMSEDQMSKFIEKLSEIEEAQIIE